MPLSPVYRATSTYPFVRLGEAAAERRARGLEVIDLGMGDPREPTDPAILQALRDGVRERMGYPAAVGLPELREAVTGWIGRRFGVSLDPNTHVIPTLGSKEAIYSFAQVVLDVPGGRDTVVVTEPGYPVPGRGAAFAGGQVIELPLREAHGFLPALDDVPDDVWERAALVWLDSPNNPTGAVAPLAFLERLAALARKHGFVLGSDEAYTELWFDAPPPSALQLDDLTNVVAFNTLSKALVDDRLPERLRGGRPRARRGAAPVQAERRHGAAGVRPACLGRRLGRRGARRAGAQDLPAQARAAARGPAAQGPARRGLPDDDVPLDRRARGGRRPRGHAARLLESGVLVTPGSYLGPSGEGYVRYALVPTEEECARAAAILEAVL